MKRLLILFAAGLALAACDSDIQPTKAPVLDQTPVSYTHLTLPTILRV